MSYTNEPGAYRDDPAAYPTNPNVRAMDATVPVADYHDLVRWGPIFAGLVVAIATQLVLTGLGAAIGLTTLAAMDTPQGNTGEVGAAVGIWSIISLLIALFLGGWVTARACGPMNRNTALSQRQRDAGWPRRSRWPLGGGNPDAIRRRHPGTQSTPCPVPPRPGSGPYSPHRWDSATP